MLDNNFEKHIKDNLESAHISWDKEAMWDEIESQLPTEKKRRFGFVYWLSGSAIIAIAIVFLFIKKSSTTNFKTIEKKIDEIDLPIAKSSSNEKDIAKNEIALPQTAKETTTKTTTATKKTTINTKPISNKTPNQTSQTNAISSKNNTTPFSQKQAKKINPQIAKQQIETINTNTIVDFPQATEATIMNKLANKHKTISIKRLPIASLKTSPLNLLEIKEVIPTLFDTKITPVHQINKKGGISFLAYASIGLQNKQLSSTNNQETLLNLRKETEQSLEAVSTGLAIKKQFAKGLFVQVGLEYQQLNERFDYTQNEIEQLTIESDTAYHYQSLTGGKKYKKGQINAQAITPTHHTKYNQHRFINMPILVGYRYALKQWTMSAAAGPVINLHQSFKGFAYADDLSILEGDEVQYFSKSNIYALDIQVETAYKLTQNINLFWGLQYRKDLKGFSINSDITQKHNIFSSRLGVRYLLNRAQ